MEDRSDSETESDTTLGGRVSDSKLMGEKRSGTDLGEDADPARKRVKMHDLESLVCSEGIDTHHPKTSKTIYVNNQFHFGEEMSQVTKEPVAMNSDDVARVGITPRDALPLLVDRASKPLDLNTNVSGTKNLVPDDTLCVNDSSNLVLLRKDERKKEVGVNSRSFHLDLNVEDVSSSVNQDRFYPYKNHNHLKSRDISECGSSTGPLEEKDPLKVWKEMKQNGFLSSSHGGIPMPKQRGRKSKNDVMKKKMEIAKKEQVDRFMKMAAPSGLLNELNPGIITNVRNMKQVHSIIEGLVRSERLEKGRVGSKHASQLKSGSKEISDRQKDQDSMNDSRPRPSFSQEDGCHNTLSGSRQTSGYHMPINKPNSLSLEERSGDADSSMVDRRINGKTSCYLDSTPGNEDDILALKMSTAKALENASSISTEENLSSVSSLSVKAATVASHWLELLHQDIKGRLAALGRSKKRVRAVIHTELPFLLSKEFSYNQENDPFVTQSSAAGCSKKAIADMHQARWSMLFDQMDKALSEEEKQLECWLNQVREMQLHCDKGLQHNYLNTPSLLQPLGMSENSSRSENVDKSERELAVRAAAASIYSTCNFLLSKENVQCF